MSIVIKGYKYRVYPNEKQETQTSKTFGCCRFVFNQILAKKIELYETESKSLSKTDCNNYCNRELKKQYSWLKEVDKFALTNSIYHLDDAYQDFFREIKKGNTNQGFPKFKSKHNHYYSYNTAQKKSLQQQKIFQQDQSMFSVYGMLYEPYEKQDQKEIFQYERKL